MDQPRGLRPLMHRAEVVHRPGGGGEIVRLATFFAEQREGFSAERLRELSGLAGELHARAETPAVRSHKDLHDFILGLERLLGSADVSTCGDPLPDWLADAGIAVDYFLRHDDIIPDELPEIGLVDDARVVALAFTRHRELDRFL